MDDMEDEDEGARPLAESLLLAVADLLFCPDFTVQSHKKGRPVSSLLFVCLSKWIVTEGYIRFCCPTSVQVTFLKSETLMVLLKQGFKKRNLYINKMFFLNTFLNATC